jgi:subtilisin family serine protease
MVNAPEAWARGYTGQGVTVAVIDSGVDINHADLRNNIWRNTREIANNGVDDDRNGYIDDVFGWNFGIGQNNNNVLPGTAYNDHGTHVAGTIAALRNNVGMTGIAPNARIMAIRLGNVSSEGYFTNAGSLATAVRYAVNNGARVINMSLGWGDSAELRDALAYATSRNVIVVSSAGNNQVQSPGNPSLYAINYGFAVGAIDISRDIADFSNLAGTDSRMRYVSAPGVGVYSTLPGNLYGFKDGTSMAAPHVAGVVALMLSANPNLTHTQVRQILIDTATYLS